MYPPPPSQQPPTTQAQPPPPPPTQQTTPQFIKCPYCGYSFVPVKARFCPQCGAKLKWCPNGHLVAPDAKFCPICGAEIKEEQK